MHLLDEYGEELTTADIDEWYESLSNEDIYDILAAIDPTDVINGYFATDEMVSLVEGIPQEWREEIIRAYTVFGLDEFGIFGKSGAALKDWLSEKAEKQARDPKGMFRQVRALLAKEVIKKTNPDSPVLTRVKPLRKRVTEDESGNITAVHDIERPKPRKLFKKEKAIKDPFEGIDPQNRPDIHLGREDGTGEIDDPIDLSKHLTANGEFDYELAIDLMTEGKHVRINDGEQLRTLVGKVGEMHKAAKAKGEKIVHNLCQAAIPGTSLFCKVNIGKPRVVMPQGDGDPFPGSIAAENHIIKEGKSRADVGDELTNLVSDTGYAPQLRLVEANKLTASQQDLDTTDLSQNLEIWNDRIAQTYDRLDRKIAEVGADSPEGKKLTDLKKRLNGDQDLLLRFADFTDWQLAGDREKNEADKLAKAAKAGQTLPKWGENGELADDQTDLLERALEESMAEGTDMADIIKDEHLATKSRATMIDQNGYIIDGHHRWATDVIMNGNAKMMVKRIPLDIGEILDLYTAATTMYGIKPAGASDKERAEIDAWPQEKIDARVAKAEKDLRTMLKAMTDWDDSQVDEYIQYMKAATGKKSKNDVDQRVVPPWLAKIRESNAKSYDDASIQLDSTRRNAMEARADAAKRRAARQSKQRELVPA